MRLQTKIMAAVIPLLLIAVLLMTGVVNYFAQVSGLRLVSVVLQEDLGRAQTVVAEGYRQLLSEGTAKDPAAVQAAQAQVLQTLRELPLVVPLYLFVVNDQGEMLLYPSAEWVGRSIQDQIFWSQLQSQPARVTFSTLGLRGKPELAMAYFFPGWGWYIGVAGETAFFQADIYRGLNISVAVAFMALLAMSGALYLLSRRLTRPLLSLVIAAEQIGQGRLDIEIEKSSADEAGMLVDTFNQMRLQLLDLIGNLEARVAERTQAAEERSQLLEQTARLARDVAAIRDAQTLPEQAVRLIAGQLGFYHVGLFLVDATRENAVLVAASSEGGQRMLARGHRRRMGEGIVGTVAQTGLARIALDVDADQVWVRNPDLPETRSEMALPLKGREEVIGVLDVQSEKGRAFSPADVAILQTLAEQVALALENARLLAASEQARLALEAAYGQQGVAYWQAEAALHPRVYWYDRTRVLPLPPEQATALLAAAPVSPDAPQVTPAEQRLIAPLRLRDRVVGTVVLQRTAEQPPWSSQELAVVETITAQAMQALEIARLLEETRARAAREQLLGQLSAAFSRSLDVESVLQTAVRELGRLLELDEVTAHIGTPPEA